MMDCDIWGTVKNGSYFPTHRRNDVLEIKPSDHWTKEDKGKV